MGYLTKLGVVGLTALALAGCAGTELQRARTMKAGGSPFDTALNKEYMALATDEYGEGDYVDSDVFAGRAEASAKGQSVAPEAISARRLPGDKVGELTQARGRLVAALDGNGRTRSPDVAARAQAMYDCWMQEQEENFQPNDIKACRDGFNDAMAKLEGKPALMVKATGNRVFFDFDKAVITPDAKPILQNVAAEAKSKPGTTITAVGHTDTAGSAAYNLRLSQRRAAAVKDALVSMGVSPTAIQISGVGQTQLLVPTPDNVPEPQNRRVEITMQ